MAGLTQQESVVQVAIGRLAPPAKDNPTPRLHAPPPPPAMIGDQKMAGCWTTYGICKGGKKAPTRRRRVLGRQQLQMTGTLGHNKRIQKAATSRRNGRRTKARSYSASGCGRRGKSPRRAVHMAVQPTERGSKGGGRAHCPRSSSGDGRFPAYSGDSEWHPLMPADNSS